MLEDEKEISELRALFDELWNDAKTMIKDMSNSISMYKFSAFLCFMICGFPIATSVGGFSKLLLGSTDFLDYFNAFFGVFAAVFFLWFGVRLLRWYYKLKERYAKLLEMESTVED